MSAGDGRSGARTSKGVGWECWAILSVCVKGVRGRGKSEKVMFESRLEGFQLSPWG